MMRTSFAVILFFGIGLSGCATEMKGRRSPSSSEDGSLIRFMESLADKSAVEKTAFLGSFIDSVNRDSEDLSFPAVHSVDDLRALSASDQNTVITKLSKDLTLKKDLAVSDEAIRTAQREAFASAETSSASAPATAAASTLDTGSSPRTLINLSDEIERMSGVRILGPDCGSLRDPDALSHLEETLRGTHDALAASGTKDAAEIGRLFDAKLSGVTGVNLRIAHSRRCELARPGDDAGSCKILAPPMYLGCEE